MSNPDVLMNASDSLSRRLCFADCPLTQISYALGRFLLTGIGLKALTSLIKPSSQLKEHVAVNRIYTKHPYFRQPNYDCDE